MDFADICSCHVFGKTRIVLGQRIPSGRRMRCVHLVGSSRRMTGILMRHCLGRPVVRRETGKEQEVQVLYDEDVASHIAPRPCVLSREGQGEASAGDRAGWPSSHESGISRAPTGLPTWKATRLVALSRVAGRLGVVRDPSMCGHSLSGNREISLLAGDDAHRRSAPGRRQIRSQR